MPASAQVRCSASRILRLSRNEPSLPGHLRGCPGRAVGCRRLKTFLLRAKLEALAFEEARRTTSPFRQVTNATGAGSHWKEGAWRASGAILPWSGSAKQVEAGGVALVLFSGHAGSLAPPRPGPFLGSCQPAAPARRQTVWSLASNGNDASKMPHGSPKSLAGFHVLLLKLDKPPWARTARLR